MHDRTDSLLFTHQIKFSEHENKRIKNSNYWSKCTPEWQWKKRKGGDQEEDSEGPGGITDPDYAHSISPSERESFGPHRPIQLPLAWGKTVLRSSQDTQHMKANMLTYREAETAHISELNTNRQRATFRVCLQNTQRGLQVSKGLISSERRRAVMTVAAPPAQCQDAFKRTVMSADVIRRAPRHEHCLLQIPVMRSSM